MPKPSAKVATMRFGKPTGSNDRIRYVKRNTTGLTLKPLTREGVRGVRNSGIDSGEYVDVLSRCGSALMDIVVSRGKNLPQDDDVNDFLRQLQSIQKSTSKAKIFNGNHSDNTETLQSWMENQASVLTICLLLSELFQNAMGHPLNNSGDEFVPSICPWEFEWLETFSEEVKTKLLVPHYDRNVYLLNKARIKSGQPPLPSEADILAAGGPGFAVVVSATATPFLQPGEDVAFSSEHIECAEYWMEFLNRHFYNFLFQNTGNGARQMISVPGLIDDGFGALQELKRHFMQNSWQYRYRLSMSVYDMKIPSFNDPREAIQLFTNTVERLKSIDIHNTEQSLQAILINKLDENTYKDLILKFTDKLADERDAYSSAQMCLKIQAYYDNHRDAFATAKAQNKHSVAEANSIKNKRLNNATQEGPKRQKTDNSLCSFCNMTGHTCENCFQNPASSRYNPKFKPKQGKTQTKPFVKAKQAQTGSAQAKQAQTGPKTGQVCTTCGKPNHTAQNCRSVACTTCGGHFLKNQNHKYNHCDGTKTGSLNNSEKQIVTFAETVKSTPNQKAAQQLRLKLSGGSGKRGGGRNGLNSFVNSFDAIKEDDSYIHTANFAFSQSHEQVMRGIHEFNDMMDKRSAEDLIAGSFYDGSKHYKNNGHDNEMISVSSANSAESSDPESSKGWTKVKTGRNKTERWNDAAAETSAEISPQRSPAHVFAGSPVYGPTPETSGDYNYVPPAPAHTSEPEHTGYTDYTVSTEDTVDTAGTIESCDTPNNTETTVLMVAKNSVTRGQPAQTQTEFNNSERAETHVQLFFMSESCMAKELGNWEEYYSKNMTAMHDDEIDKLVEKQLEDVDAILHVDNTIMSSREKAARIWVLAKYLRR
mmetsp:Transcript_14643/g.35375  ORF Transcript_14643/g.35375 Transcript_14643/m.35375 type:complete len:875 (+) Transcript_14643:935-3559(+)